MNGVYVFESSVDNLGSYSHFYLKIVVRYLRGGQDYDPTDVATLFHELMHYAQFMSTVAGILYLDNLISIWNNSRVSISSRDNRAALEQLAFACNSFNIFNDNNNEDFDKNYFSDIDIESIDFGEGQLTFEPVKIRAFLEGEEIFIGFGVYEFFESAAYILEKFFREKIGLSNESYRIPSIPYKIGEAVTHFYDPCCSTDRVIMLLLAAMLHPSPHQTFVKFANDLSLVDWSDLQVRANLEKTAVEMTESNQEWVKERVLNIRKAFSLKDPHFGDLVVDLFCYAESFLQRRSKYPMFELDFLGELDAGNYASKVAEFCDSFGGVLIFKKIEDGILKGFREEEVLSLGTKEGVFHDLHKLEVFQASIHYALAHVCLRDDVVSVSLPNSISPCPLFASCNHKNKELNAEICSTQPWQHPQASDGSVDCSYQIAAYGFNLSNARPSL